MALPRICPICGPKCSMCCMVFGAWGTIFLAILGIMFYTQSVLLFEDIHYEKEASEFSASEISERPNGTIAYYLSTRIDRDDSGWPDVVYIECHHNMETSSWLIGCICSWRSQFLFVASLYDCTQFATGFMSMKFLNRLCAVFWK
uniref:Uncharacterized protein n=1 Tax=Trichuris muris TaxID=70415 RepID=A0A5S6Q6P1_TRIMR